MKLSPLQIKVIKCLQNDWWLFTDNTIKGAEVISENGKEQFHVSNRVFYNLLQKDLIYQQHEHPFNYVLTLEGETIKLK